jgi:eukaryotic-like serine/threonine-protein kinase
MRITLTVTEGPHKGKLFSFVGHDTFLVGRSPRTHFRLSEEDRFFSRIHFLIEANPPRCRLLDMKSRNGTFVNGERVESRELRDGDQIKAGRTIIRVAFEVTASSASMPVVTPAPEPVKRPIPVIRAAAESSAVPVERGSMPGTRCPVCGSAPVPSSEDTICLCRECREKSRKQAQPVGAYRVVQELGSGAMGLVALAIRIGDGLPVALKTVTPAVAGRPQQLERFLREAKILSQIRHPNVVAFHDMGESDGLLWFAMDYVRGLDASRLLRQEGPLPVGRAVNLICQLLDALAHAHEQKFVHRDIKPANLLVEKTGDTERLKLADFGLARVYQTSQLSGLTLSGDFGGTVGFMAPEQITDFRETEPSADLYSVAASLYNLLTGAYIFELEGDLKSRLLAILQDDPIPIQERLPDLPAALAKIIHCGLEREPHKRWSSATAFRTALSPFAKQK